MARRTRKERTRRLAGVVAVTLIGTVAAVDASGQTPAGSDVPGARPEALEALDAYVGTWRSEEKTGPEGESFRFDYELRWLDDGRTIARMRITRVSPAGSSVVFEGYKGLDPDGGVYYFAASPSGRGACGRVVTEGQDLVTVYEGWTPDGTVVEIRDVFGPVDESGEAFVSRTFLRPDPDADWRKIGEDRWRREG